MENEYKRKALKKLIIAMAAELFLVAVAVWIIDPFYQYHAPVLGEGAVLNDRDNQMPGSIRNFQYDSVLVGSSVAENFDSKFLDDAYDCNTLKIIRASGSVADLLYYLEMAQAGHKLENVFWCLDILSMAASTEVTLYGKDVPRYLHTKTVLDDLPYLYNKEILFEKIPAQLVSSRQGINTGGQAYNWSRGKEFSAVQAMRAYDRNAIQENVVIEAKDLTQVRKLLDENIGLLTEQIRSHPEIRYRFLIPPYSLLWWDCAYVNGELEERFTILEEMIPALLAFENVEIYFFPDQEEIVCNLDNYMDMVHYSPDINQFMLERLVAGENRLTGDNMEEIMGNLHEMAEYITTRKIFEYYPSAVRLAVTVQP